MLLANYARSSLQKKTHQTFELTMTKILSKFEEYIVSEKKGRLPSQPRHVYEKQIAHHARLFRGHSKVATYMNAFEDNLNQSETLNKRGVLICRMSRQELVHDDEARVPDPLGYLSYNAIFNFGVISCSCLS